MKKTVTLLLAFSLGVIALCAATSGAAAALSLGFHPEQDYPPLPGNTPIVIGPPSINPVEHSFSLSIPQQQSALQIAVHDSFVKQLLRGKPYHAKGVVVWASQHKKLLGGVVTLSMDRPVILKGRWLYLNYDCAETAMPPYGRVPYVATYHNVSAVTVYVDMTRKVVAGISPAGQLVGKAQFPAHFRRRPQIACRYP
jgi:hypothetical protein